MSALRYAALLPVCVSSHGALFRAFARSEVCVAFSRSEVCLVVSRSEVCSDVSRSPFFRAAGPALSYDLMVPVLASMASSVPL